MTATDEDLMEVMREGARFGAVLDALTAAGAKPEPEGREGLFGPSMAIFGAGRTYRYLLTRRLAPGRLMTWVMLNPSTADAFTDDATIARVTHRATHAGFGGLTVVNLFALRATDPAALRTHPDPVGTGNDACILTWCQPGDTIVAAWGSHGAFLDRGTYVERLLRDATKTPLLHLGVTANGEPRHPGRVAYTLKLTPWEQA